MTQSIKSVEEALESLLAFAKNTQKVETLPLYQCHGRYLAEDLLAPRHVPNFDASTMDGYALGQDYAPGDCFSISQRITAGDQPQPLTKGTAARIFTGAPLPSGADRVIPQEATTETDQGIQLNEVLPQGANIRPQGSDLTQGQVALTKGEKLSPQALGLAASMGYGTLKVYQPLRVAIFTTGDELLPPGAPYEEGKIYNTNRFMLQGLIKKLGLELIDLGQVEDTFAATQAALKEAAQVADIIMTTGGVSVGEEDHIKPAVESLGRIHMWQVRMKPGKPFVFGEVKGTAFLGLPGNPVSALTTFALFALPFIKAKAGAKDQAWLNNHQGYRLPLGFDWPKGQFRRQYLRARLNNQGQLEIHPNQNSGVLSSTLWAEGVVIIPEETSLQKGDKATFIPYEKFLS